MDNFHSMFVTFVQESWELSRQHLRFDTVLYLLDQESTDQIIKFYFVTEACYILLYDLGYCFNSERTILICQIASFSFIQFLDVLHVQL